MDTQTIVDRASWLIASCCELDKRKAITQAIDEFCTQEDLRQIYTIFGIDKNNLIEDVIRLIRFD